MTGVVLKLESSEGALALYKHYKLKENKGVWANKRLVLESTHIPKAL